MRAALLTKMAVVPARKYFEAGLVWRRKGGVRGGAAYLSRPMRPKWVWLKAVAYFRP